MIGQNFYRDPQSIVYCKPVQTLTGKRMIAVFNPDGDWLTTLRDEESAFRLACQNDLEPVWAH